MPTPAEENTPTPQMVGNAFVEQYYNVLCQSPEIVHKFYHNSGVISRPGSDGQMATASTLEGIEKMILSHDYKNCVVQILTTDAQESFGDGVIVLVTGYFTVKDSNRRKFTQLFFLAPQASRASFSVLNDVLRYVDDEEPMAIKISNVDDPAPVAPVTPDPEPISVSNDTTLDHSVEVDIAVANEPVPLENGKISAADKEFVSSVVVDSSLKDGSSVSVAKIHVDDPPIPDAIVAPSVQDDAPKKSYASVANALNFKKEPFQQRALPPKPVEQRRAIVNAVPEVSPHQVAVKSVERNSPAIVKGHSIFVANLPMDATVEQLKEAFEKFGPIKPNGVQVRSYKIEKNCFGFVEFESASSMQSAVEAASLKIGDRMANIEQKKASNEGGKFANRKGGFRGDNFRGRGNFGGARGGYGRNEFDNQAGLSGQSRWSGRRNGDTNKKVYQNGSGRAARPEAQVEGGKS